MALVVAYNFDEDTGKTIHDLSGNGHTMPLPPSGTVPNWGAGHTGTALTGNGTGQDSSQQWGILHSDWSTWMPTAAITTMCWAQVTASSPQYQALIAIGGSTGLSGNFDTWVMGGNAIQIMMRTAAAPSTTVQVVSSNPDNAWHHWAATYDGTTLKFYKDGVSQGTATASGPVGYPDTANFTIAGTQGSNFTPYQVNGAVDDVRIYNVALTQAQVIAQMNTPVQRSLNGWGIGI